MDFLTSFLLKAASWFAERAYQTVKIRQHREIFYSQHSDCSFEIKPVSQDKPAILLLFESRSSSKATRFANFIIYERGISREFVLCLVWSEIKELIEFLESTDKESHPFLFEPQKIVFKQWHLAENNTNLSMTVTNSKDDSIEAWVALSPEDVRNFRQALKKYYYRIKCFHAFEIKMHYAPESCPVESPQIQTDSPLPPSS